MRLIVEAVEQPEFIVETKDGKKDWYIVGKYIIGEQKNKNGRIYPIDVLEGSIEKYIQEWVIPKRAYGELGHPSGPTVNLDRASHRILALKQEGNIFEGKSILADTTYGNTAKGLLETGGTLGVSTRGMGSLQEKNGAMEVQKDFRLSSVDIVSDPSGPGCFVNGIMEGVEYFFDSIKGTWKEERVEELAKQAKQMNKEEREAKALELFEAYFALLVDKDLDEDKSGKWLNAVQRKVDTGRLTTKGASSSGQLVKSTGRMKPLIRMGSAERAKTMNTTVSGQYKG